MAKRVDIPIVSGKLENLLHDIGESWNKHSKWAIPVAFFFVAMVVLYDVIKKRWLK